MATEEITQVGSILARIRRNRPVDVIDNDEDLVPVSKQPEHVNGGREGTSEPESNAM